MNGRPSDSIVVNVESEGASDLVQVVVSVSEASIALDPCRRQLVQVEADEFTHFETLGFEFG